MADHIYGRNAVRELLRARRRHVHRLMLAENTTQAAILEEITELATALGLPIDTVPRKKLDSIAKVHQGVVAETGRYPTVEVEDMLVQAAKKGRAPFLLVPDHVEDPHNLGAILRTAEVVGVDGVIIPKKRAAQITPTVVNVSAGATEHLPIALVGNLAETLKKLKKAEVWVVGVEATTEAVYLHQANLSGGIALVIGSEGRGISQLVQRTCDYLVKIPMQGQINSLNASVATGIALYEVWRARHFA